MFHKQLTYLGLLPFIIFSAAILSKQTAVLGISNIPLALSSYTIVIFSFMTGIYWGLFIHDEKTFLKHLPLLSNISVISLWMVFLFCKTHIFLALSALFFIALLFIEKSLLSKGVIRKSYFKTRCIVSSYLIACLLLSSIAL